MEAQTALQACYAPTAMPKLASTRLDSREYLHLPIDAGRGHASTAMNRIGTSTLLIVSPGQAIREALAPAARSLNWDIQHFDSVEAFRRSNLILGACCLILDVALAGIDGLDLQAHLAVDRPGMPIVLINGAIEALVPFVTDTAGTALLALSSASECLSSVVAQVIEKSRPVFARWARVHETRERFQSLSRREHEVMALVVMGHRNKAVGLKLGITEITVKAHRANIMRKMRATSLPGLVHMASCVGLPVCDE